MQPLEGIRIADFSHVMAGPYASHLLRLLGAEVIKVESPGRGDAMRFYGYDRRYDGMSPAFIGVNVGKKSITLNLKKSAALAAAKKLVESADVVLENFRPGVMTRLGLGYDACKALNPGVVYCSVSGYGQSGPLRDWPAIDNIVQATSGMMSLSGEAGGDFMRVGFPVVDTITGQLAAFAILAALFRRQKNGEGEYIDVAMLDASLAFMTAAVVPFLVSGKTLPRTGNTGYSGQPTTGLFTGADGRQISLGVVQQHQFEALARHLNRENWLQDPRYQTADLRLANADAMKTELAEVIKTRTAEDWEASMSAANIPCGMVRNVSEAAALPHLAQRGLKIPISIPPDLPAPPNGTAEVLNAGFIMRGDGPGVEEGPPVLGADTEAVLTMLGYTAEEIKEIMD
jgi:crotonobetainyl-CoA:carnitine CoA-transferase CaiB-like acyl-CoA transferase